MRLCLPTSKKSRPKSRDSLSQSEHGKSLPRSTRPRTSQTLSTHGEVGELSQSEHARSRDSMRSRSTRTTRQSRSQERDEALLDSEGGSSNHRRSRQSVTDRRAAFSNRRSSSFRQTTNSRAQHLDAEKKLKGLNSNDEGVESEKPTKEGRRVRGAGLARSSSLGAAEMRQSLYGGDEKTAPRRKLKATASASAKATEEKVEASTEPEKPRADSSHDRETALRMMSVGGQLAW